MSEQLSAAQAACKKAENELTAAEKALSETPLTDFAGLAKAREQRETARSALDEARRRAQQAESDAEKREREAARRKAEKQAQEREVARVERRKKLDESLLVANAECAAKLKPIAAKLVELDEEKKALRSQAQELIAAVQQNHAVVVDATKEREELAPAVGPVEAQQLAVMLLCERRRRGIECSDMDPYRWMCRLIDAAKPSGETKTYTLDDLGWPIEEQMAAIEDSIESWRRRRRELSDRRRARVAAENTPEARRKRTAEARERAVAAGEAQYWDDVRERNVSVKDAAVTAAN